MRGNLPEVEHPDPFIGSIPACAGEPGAIRRHAGQGEVYPRVCGGTRTTLGTLTTNGGLSPRVRGNLLWFLTGIWASRSIPACAGEPGVVGHVVTPNMVYPRVCGGTNDNHQCPSCSRGLSPRVRGNQPDGLKSQPGCRSIPACAGEPRGNAGAS